MEILVQPLAVFPGDRCAQHRKQTVRYECYDLETNATTPIVSAHSQGAHGVCVICFSVGGIVVFIPFLFSFWSHWIARPDHVADLWSRQNAIPVPKCERSRSIPSDHFVVFME